MPYEAQSRSLINVQVRGKSLEAEIKGLLNIRENQCRIPYASNSRATIQADIVLPSSRHPEVILSITHTKPDTFGHSNENKFQLKLGELALWKKRNPNLKIAVVVGGEKVEWLSYILDAFPYFFDDYIYVWNNDDLNKLTNWRSILNKNTEFWQQENELCEGISFSKEAPPNSFLRERFYNIIVKRNMGVSSPSEIDNTIFRRCMESAYNLHLTSDGRSGKEWERLSQGSNEDYNKFWELRNFFNPSEAAVMMTLEKMGIPFLGNIAEDVTLPSMLHDLGMPMKKTKVAEDFVVWSQRYNKPVFIQCKSSGGGKERHGKNIQNRAKEQVGRGILYRCSIVRNPQIKLISKGKWYMWIGVLDGDWGTTKSYPLKYIHMLQIAGYDKLLPADSLIDDVCELQYENPLSRYLQELECNISWEEFKSKMEERSIGEGISYRFQSHHHNDLLS